MPSRRINNFPENRRGLGHVTLQFLAVRSAILATAWLLVFYGLKPEINAFIHSFIQCCTMSLSHNIRGSDVKNPLYAVLSDSTYSIYTYRFVADLHVSITYSSPTLDTTQKIGVWEWVVI